VVDELSVGERRPLPRQKTLALLVGRITTIKLAYWAALTLIELALPRVLDRGFTERFPLSIALAAVITLIALAWARWQARVVDRRAGGIERGLATIATTFVAASVVGREFGLNVLERVCERPRDELLELLAEAVNAGVIEEVGGVRGRFSFVHALVRETLYARFPGARRSRNQSCS